MKQQNNYAQKLLLSLQAYLLVVVVAVVMFFVIKNYQNYEHSTKQPREYAISLLVNFFDKKIDNVLRERRESAIYVLSVLLVAAVGFVTTFLSHKYWLKFLQKKDLTNFYTAFAVVNIFMAFVVCYFSFKPGNSVELLSKTLAGYSIFLVFCVTVLIFILCCFSSRWRGDKFTKIVKFISWFLVIILACWIASYGIFDEYSWAIEVGSVNFDFVSDPIIQQYLGNNLLVDFKSYYGLYPYFIAPILHIIPPTVLSLTIILVVLFVIALVAIFAVISVSTNNCILAFCGFVVLIFVQNFIGTPALRNGAVIYQYESIRLFFPSLLLLFLTTYYRQPTTRKYWLILLVSASATIWNFDSGLPTFVTAVIVLGHEKMKQNFELRKFIQHLQNSLIALLAAWLAFILYVKVHSNSWPNFSWILYGQKAAYDYAIAMMPAESCGLWWFFALTYLIGLLMAMDNFWRKNHSLQNSMILSLTILGIGLMTYFVGRSVENNLFHSGYPAVILLIIFADKFCHYLQSDKKEIWLDAVTYSVPLFIISFLTTAFWCNFSRGFFVEKTVVVKVLTRKLPQEMPYWISEANFIKQHLGNSSDKVREDVLLIADNNQNFYFDLELRSRSVMSNLNVREIFYQEDFDAISELIKNNKRKFVILVLSQNKEVPPSMSVMETNSLQKLLAKHYQMLAEKNFSSDDAVYIYQSKK